MKRPPSLLFGIPIANVTMDETIDEIGDLVDLGRALQRTHQVATVNLDFIANALTDTELHTILQHADLNLADGMPIVWAASWLGMPIEGRVAGSDLFPLLVAQAHARDWTIHVLGSSPDVAARASTLLRQRHPDARLTIDPGIAPIDPMAVDDALIESIRAIDPDILCVALGNPKQEWFITHQRERLGVPVMIGVGGSLDMLVGERRRAPKWAQRAGLEWVVRAAQEPGRLGRRYARDVKIFAPRFGRHWQRVRRRRNDESLSIDVHPDRVAVVVGRPTRSDGDDRWADAMRALGGGSPLHIGIRATTIDDATAARLVGLVTMARRAGAEPVWRDAPRSLERRLDEIGVWSVIRPDE